MNFGSPSLLPGNWRFELTNWKRDFQKCSAPYVVGCQVYPKVLMALQNLLTIEMSSFKSNLLVSIRKIHTPKGKNIKSLIFLHILCLFDVMTSPGIYLCLSTSRSKITWVFLLLLKQLKLSHHRALYMRGQWASFDALLAPTGALIMIVC